jgi:PTS system mannose-specific IID component
MLNSIFFRSFNVFAGAAGSTKAGASGFIWSLLPALERYYPEKERLTKAMQRHNIWYNITQNVGTFAMGLVASMEKESSEKPDFDTQSIVAIKTSLMGPMSGIGDAIFWGIVRVIAAGVAIGMAATGSLMAPLVFLIAYNVPSVLCRYYMTYLGYTLGSTFIERIYASGGMKILTKAASTVGLMMVGGMCASMVKFSTILQMEVPGSDPILVQTYLDQLLVGIVPLLLSLGCFYLLQKRVNVNIVMLGVLILALLLALLGVV